MIVKALQQIFDSSYPETDFRNVNVTMEFPNKPQDYPGIWVQFEDTADLERSGIAHLEVVVDDDGVSHAVTRWKFGGTLSLTASALSNAERDRLFDEVVRVFAFSGIDESPAGKLKSIIEQSDLIGINFNYDILTPSGNDETPGTPWNTNEVIYEKTLGIPLIGEFVSDIQSSMLYPLSRVVVNGYVDGETDVEELIDVTSNDPYDPTQWI